MSADYSNGIETVAIPQPEKEVAMNTVTYIKGRGMSLRVVTVPGSRPELFIHDTLEMGMCQCSPPAVWQFTAIDGDMVVILYTLDPHEAMHFLGFPDELFAAKDGDYGDAALCSELVFVPEEEGLGMVAAEAAEWVAQSSDHSELVEEGFGYSDVLRSDIGSDIAAWLKESDGDSQTE